MRLAEMREQGFMQFIAPRTGRVIELFFDLPGVKVRVLARMHAHHEVQPRQNRFRKIYVELTLVCTERALQDLLNQ